MTKSNGFTMLEMLITILIISSLFVVSVNTFENPDLSWTSFSNDYLTKQTSSLVNKEVNYVNSSIHFNENGRVNRANTINKGNMNIIIHLGSGYLTYEK